VVIDDSIVRGTTLEKKHFLKMLDRLDPKKIVVVSSAPRSGSPIVMGIDMSRWAILSAFRAMIHLVKETRQGFYVGRNL